MLFSKKKKKDEKKEIDIAKQEKKHVDIVPTETDFFCDISPALLEAIEKGIISLPKDNNHNTYGERLDKLDKNGELPQGWYLNNKTIIDNFSTQITDYAQKARSAPIEKKPIIYKKMIQMYYDFKSMCYSKNECFAKYFSDMWEHCSNSMNPDFEYIKPFEDELKEIEENYITLLQNEQIIRNAMPKLRDKIIEIVSENTDGILQTDIYHLFDEVLKDTIKEEIYQCYKENLITRQKQGRTYLIKIK